MFIENKYIVDNTLKTVFDQILLDFESIIKASVLLILKTSFFCECT